MKILIIADDLTGANDTGALLADLGMKVASTLHTRSMPPFCEHYDALAIDAASRSMDSAAAYRTVCTIVSNFTLNSAAMISKRIDSTLRGNIGSEIDAVLDTVNTPHKALVVSAFPRANRTCINGNVLVNGTLLENTDLANDPLRPVTSSNIINIIAKDSKRKAILFPLDTVRQSPRSLALAISQADADILVFDAQTDEDIAAIAKATVLSEIAYICVDPGVYTSFVAKERYTLQAKAPPANRALIVVGSCMKPSKDQIDYLHDHHNLFVVQVDVQRLLDTFDEECARVLGLVNREGLAHSAVCITTAYAQRVQDAHRIPKIADNLCRLSQHLLDQTPSPFSICYLSGGDVAKDFLTQCRAEGIDIISEVLPLAIYGTIIGGKYDGMRLLTKGGAIGNEQAIADMLQTIGFILERKGPNR